MTPDYWKTACRDLAKADPVMKKLIATYPVANFRSRGTPFATLARAIVGQQISVKAAASVWAKFAKCVGRMTPANVLAHDVEALRDCGLSRQKASYILDLAAHFADGRINTRKWAREDDEIIIGELVAVKGIGRWTAEMFLMFYLMRPNILPVDDLGLIRGTEKVYFKGRKCLDRKKDVFIWAALAAVEHGGDVVFVAGDGGCAAGLKMKRVLTLLLIIGLCIGAAAFAQYKGLNFWFSLAAAMWCFAWTGLVTKLQNDLPGTHNNPDGASTPTYVPYVVWSTRIIGVVALIGIAVSLSMLKFH